MNGENLIEFLASESEAIRKDKLSDIEQLQEFVTDNAELEQLEDLLGQFNLFEAIGMVWQEIKHSSFLAFLLNPNEAHGLGDTFLKRVIQRALLGADTQRLPLHVVELHLLELDGTTVERERSNIDILLLNHPHQLAVIIENKVLTDEHDNQLDKYYQTVSHQYPKYRILGLYLTPTGAPASHPQYLSVSYESVAEIIETLVATRQSVIGSDIRMVMIHYIQMLRRHIVNNEEIAGFCRRIYQKHQKAIDLIRSHIPDKNAQIIEYCRTMIEATPGLRRRYASKREVGFHPLEWELPALQYSPPEKSNSLIFQFYIFCNNFGLKLILVIRPGKKATRVKLFDMAKSHTDIFNPKNNKFPKIKRVFSQTWMSAKNVEATELSLIQMTVSDRFNQFLRSDLPLIIQVVNNTDWIQDTNAPYANDGEVVELDTDEETEDEE